MKRIIGFFFVGICICLYAFSITTFALNGETKFDWVIYKNTNLNATTYLRQGTYKYDDLGVNWKWTSNAKYYSGGNVYFQSIY